MDISEELDPSGELANQIKNLYHETVSETNKILKNLNQGDIGKNVLELMQEFDKIKKARKEIFGFVNNLTR